MRAGHRFGGHRRGMLLLCVAIIGLVATVPMVRAGAVPQASVTFYSGPVGVIKDDVLRVNVTNLNATTQQAQVTVIDEKGSTLGKTTLTLAAGQTGFFDVTLNGIVGRLMARTRTICKNNAFLVSTEIYDASTQQTDVTLNPSDLVINGQGLFPAVGIVDGQTARLSVANLGATTADVTLDFMEQDGKVIKEAILSVAPTQTGFLDYDGDGILGKMILRATGGAGAGKFAMSMEVFDTLTGRTGFIWFED